MILTISPSSFDKYQQCPTKYRYGTMERLVSASADTKKMDQGFLFHELLQLHYKLLMEDVPQNEIIMHVTNLARERGTTEDYPVETIEACVRNYQEYAVYYQNDGIEVVAVEAPFSVVIYEDEKDKIVLEGRIDLIAKTSPGVKPSPWDHKTTERKEQANSMSNQFFSYALVTDSFVLIKNEIGFQKTYGPSERFHRFTLNYPEPNLLEWKTNLIVECLKLIKMIEDNHFPMNLSSCWRCQYKRICEADPIAREHTKERLYEKNVLEGFDIYGS